MILTASGFPPPLSYLAEKQPRTTKPYSFAICPPSVRPIGITLASAPSGSHELVLSNLGQLRNGLTVQVTGGHAGQTYTLAAQAFGDDGNQYQTLVFLPISTTLERSPPRDPTSQGFGAAISWGQVMTQFNPSLPTGGVLTLVTGGATSIFASSIVNGAIIANPLSATDQGIGSAEPIWVNLAGSTAVIGGGGSSIEVLPGQQMTLFGIAGVVSWTAATAGHKISGVSW